MVSQGHVGKQFFHGSPEDFEPGDTIKPGSEIGKQTRGDTEPGKVYVTPHAFVAAQYTWRYDHEGKLADDPKAGPSGHVYEVEPVGRVLKDKNAPAHIPGLSYTAREARVVRKVDRKEWAG